ICFIIYQPFSPFHAYKNMRYPVVAISNFALSTIITQQVRSKIQLIDSTVSYLISRLEENGLSKQTNLLFLSDHGMSEIKPEKVLYLEKCDRQYPGLKYELVGVSPVYSI